MKSPKGMEERYDYLHCFADHDIRQLRPDGDQRRTGGQKQINRAEAEILGIFLWRCILMVGVTKTDGIIFLIVVVLIVLDIISGVIAALANRQWKSNVMRTGLLHKCSLLLVMALGIVVNIGQGYLDFGVTLPVYEGLSAYIAIMEIGSVIENVCKGNPDLAPERLRAVFGMSKEDKEKDT